MFERESKREKNLEMRAMAREREAKKAAGNKPKDAHKESKDADGDDDLMNKAVREHNLDSDWA